MARSVNLLNKHKDEMIYKVVTNEKGEAVGEVVTIIY